MNGGERRLCDYFSGKGVGFFKSLFDAIFKADDFNTGRLERAFHEEVGAVRRYKIEDGYWEDLMNEYEGKDSIVDVEG